MKLRILLLLIIFSSVGLFSKVLKNPSGEIDKWYSNGVFYHILVRSFYDSDGDRYGDFNGLTEKLDYIEELGVKNLWLMPITASYEKTNNYDPIDFMAVDETYGTMKDFENFLAKAHKRGMKVILDLVPNHTSNEHPYFKDASTNKNSKYRDWYVWTDKKRGGGKWHESPTGYYYGYFVNTKPDLNYDNPEVMEYFKNVMRFWLDKGVDGFRFDAVSHIFDDNQKNKIAFREFRSVIKEDKYKDKDIFIIAETSARPYSHTLGNDMFHAVFNFPLAKTFLNYAKSGSPVGRSGTNFIGHEVGRMFKELKKGTFYGTLLTNHDIFTGHRPYQQFDENIGQTKLAGSIYLTLPGIPFVYYGEELAMGTYTASKSDRWLRNCMIWNDNKDENYGFSSAKRPWNILNAGKDDINKNFNVNAQSKDDDSILNLYRNIIKARNDHKALSIGDFQLLSSSANEVASFLRIYNDEKILVTINFGDKKITTRISMKDSVLDGSKPEFDILVNNSDGDIKNVFSNIIIKNMKPYSIIITQIK